MKKATKSELPPCRCKHAQSSHQNGICKSCTNNKMQKIVKALWEEHEKQRIARVRTLTMKAKYLLREAAKGTACVDTDKKTPE